MTTGGYISSTAHGLLVLFVLFGGLFARDRIPPIQVADVSVITAEELAALTPPGVAPAIATQAPEPVLPDIQDAPETPEADTVPDRTELSVTEAPGPPAQAPETPPTPTPHEAEVQDTAPSLQPAAPGAELAPALPQGAPRPAERVAPEAAPPPPLDIATGPESIPDVATEAPELAETEEESEPEAPEEATTEIVTEAEESPELAPQVTTRPRGRPAPQVAQSTPPAQPTPATPPTTPSEPSETPSSSATAQSQRPVGPPLTGSETEGFKVAVQNCWVVDVGSEASRVTVVVGFSLGEDGKLTSGPDLISASGGSDTAQNTAFQAARRAIIRCQRNGYDLPIEKYAHWRDIEITFNPDGMSLR